MLLILMCLKNIQNIIVNSIIAHWKIWKIFCPKSGISALVYVACKHHQIYYTIIRMPLSKYQNDEMNYTLDNPSHLHYTVSQAPKCRYTATAYWVTRHSYENYHQYIQWYDQCNLKVFKKNSFYHLILKWLDITE